VRYHQAVVVVIMIILCCCCCVGSAWLKKEREKEAARADAKQQHQVVEVDGRQQSMKSRVDELNERYGRIHGIG